MTKKKNEKRIQMVITYTPVPNKFVSFFYEYRFIFN